LLKKLFEEYTLSIYHEQKTLRVLLKRRIREKSTIFVNNKAKIYRIFSGIEKKKYLLFLAKTGKKIAEHFLVFYVVANLLDCS
jgi:tRNA pseudouridine-54 N-methylase